MISKRNLYGIFTALLVVGFFAVMYVDFLNRRINELETTQNQTQTELNNKNLQIKTLIEQKKTMDETIVNLESNLSASQLNSSQLKSETKALNASIISLKQDVELLDEAIHLIGIGDISFILQSYSETLLELEELEKDYNQLLIKYNNLLAKQEP
ncbi:hypothetical protein ACFL0D_09035 [Thermoproteota archaeon]